MAGRQGSYSSRQYGYSRQTGSGSRTVSSHSRYSGRGGQAYVESRSAKDVKRNISEESAKEEIRIAERLNFREYTVHLCCF